LVSAKVSRARESNFHARFDSISLRDGWISGWISRPRADVDDETTSSRLSSIDGRLILDWPMEIRIEMYQRYARERGDRSEVIGDETVQRPFSALFLPATRPLGRFTARRYSSDRVFVETRSKFRAGAAAREGLRVFPLSRDSDGRLDF